MSRRAVYLAAMPVILISLLTLAGRALMWRSVGDTAAPAIAGGPVSGDAASGDDSTAPTRPRSRTETGNEDAGLDRSRADPMRKDAGPPVPAFRALMGWPGRAEAERRFAGEGKDPRWAKRMEGRLLSMVAELDGLALSRLEADCRESMCRLLLVYPPGIEPIYTIRQIYDRVDDLGLGPALAETQAEGGDVETLRLFLRRRAATSSPPR